MHSAIGILAAAYYLPPATKSAADIFRDEALGEQTLAVNVDFQRDIGIERVHCAEAEPASDLGLKAARRAVEQAGIDPGEIDLVLDFTSIPEDYVAPAWSAAGYVQAGLGADRAFATAINTGGCASYHMALKAACALMAGNSRIRTALLFAGDKTPRLNKAYYPVTIVCDVGSAVVLRTGHPRNVILAIEAATVGELHDVLYVPGFARRQPADPLPERHLHMTGQVSKFNEKVIPINLFMFRKVMRAALKRAGLKMEEIDYYIYPTFSTWDLRSFSQGFGIPLEKIYVEGMRQHGHLQENDMVVNYVDAAAAGRIRPGDRVMVTGNGAGFTWGAAIVQR